MTQSHLLQEESVADQALYQPYSSPAQSADEEDRHHNQQAMSESERQPLDDHKHAMSQYTENDNNGNADGVVMTISETIPSPSSSSPNASLQRLVLVAAATAATLGYDVGIMAAAIQPMEDTMNLNGVQKEVAMGSLNFVAALGALLGGRVANDYGRKFTVKVCCWIFVVGTILMAGAPGYWSFLLGRIVTGMGVGVSFVAAPVYLSEVVSPTFEIERIRHTPRWSHTCRSRLPTCFAGTNRYERKAKHCVRRRDKWRDLARLCSGILGAAHS
jgi:Sugar (and other) transporter